MSVRSQYGHFYAQPCCEHCAVIDRRPALRSILRSLLVTYSKLLTSLLAPPPTNSFEGEPEWKQHLEWINVLAQNVMAAANDLRPVQARGNLELMMRRQLELRREETKAIHSYASSSETVLKNRADPSRPRGMIANVTHWKHNSPSCGSLRKA